MKHTHVPMQPFQDDRDAVKTREEDQRNRKNLENWKANSVSYQINKKHWAQERLLYTKVGSAQVSKANQANKARRTRNLGMNQSLLMVDH